MARVIMTCGKICCGKTTYAEKLAEKHQALILSLDRVMLALFPDGAGEMHDVYVRRAEQYLLSLSLQILQRGTEVILDWGLWTREQRDRIRQFYQDHDIDYEIHYLRIPREEWERRIQKRNASHAEDPSSYFVDEGLLRKVESVFEEPAEDENVIVAEGI